MANPIYTGIDIGAESIKVVSLRSKGSSYQLLGAGLARLPEDIPADEDSTKIIGGVLSRLIRSQQIPVGHTIIGLGSKGSLIRCLSEPICPRWKLAMLMDFEVEEQAGSTSAVAYDFRPLNLPEFQEGQFSVLLGQAQASVVEERLTLARESIKRADELDMLCLGVFNLYAISPQCDEEKVTLILDIGAEETNISLQQGSAFYFARTISGGGRRFTSRIQQEFKISFEAAEELKLQSSGIIPETPPKPTAEELELFPEERIPEHQLFDEREKLVSKACRTETAVLSSSIHSSLVFFRNQLVKSSGTDPRNPKLDILKPEHILLTGGGSKLRGLGELLGERFHCTSAILDVAAALPNRRGSAEVAMEGGHAAQFATAAGLALSRARQEGFGFNILTESEKERRKFWDRKFYIAATAIAGLILIIFSVLNSQRSLKAAQDHDYSWRVRIDEVTEEQAELEQTIANNAMQGEMVNKIETHRSAGPDLLRALDIVRKYTPEDFFFTSFRSLDLVSRGRVKVSGGSRGSSGGGRASATSKNSGRRISLEGYCLAVSEQESNAMLNNYIKELEKIEDGFFEKVKQIKYLKEANDEDSAPFFEVDGVSVKKDSSTRAFSFSLECFIRPGR